MELLYAVVIVKFGLDKVTSVLPIILTLVVVIFKGCIYSTTDSKFQTFAYNIVKKSIFSIWTFMFLLFFFAMIVGLMLYLDSGFLMDILQNPKDLFSKNTLFGTYTNLYMKDDKKDNNNTTNVNNANIVGVNKSVEGLGSKNDSSMGMEMSSDAKNRWFC